tara:strand:+ start:508 stop:642 length:135 start_codon:yes stop_codon:yes gene_type:complete
MRPLAPQNRYWKTSAVNGYFFFLINQEHNSKVYIANFYLIIGEI